MISKTYSQTLLDIRQLLCGYWVFVGESVASCLLSSFHLHGGLSVWGRFCTFPPTPPPRAVCFLFSLGGLCATCNHFSIPSALEADLLNCFDAFSVSQFAFLQSIFGVCFLRAERISLVSRPYRLSLLTSSVPKPPPSRPETRNLSFAFLLLGLMSRWFIKRSGRSAAGQR